MARFFEVHFIRMDADHDNMLKPAEAPGISEAPLIGMCKDADGLVTSAECDAPLMTNFDDAEMNAGGLLD